MIMHTITKIPITGNKIFHPMLFTAFSPTFSSSCLVDSSLDVLDSKIELMITASDIPTTTFLFFTY